MRLAGFIRVSTTRQATEGHSLAAQEGIIRAWVRYLAAGMEQAEVETTIRGFHDAAKRACELRIPDDVARCLEKGE